MPISKRSLVFVAVFASTLGNQTRAGSLSSNGGTWNWWVSGQGQTTWSPAQRPFAYRVNSLAAATDTTAGAVNSAPAAAVTTPLVAIPYTAPTTTAAAPAAYVAPVTSTPTIQAASTNATTPTTGHADGFINLGTGPYPGDSAITTGGTQPWYNTSLVNNFFGGHPTAQQQANFSNAVLADVQHTFAASGVNVSLTNNPNVAADHTLSVVSNTSAALLPSAIGMTQVGGNGFSFMDQEAKSASTLQQLELIVAHNVSHELMLAFGVPENYDHTGNYIDAPNASFSMMTNPDATFSTSAANALNQALQSADAAASQSQLAQEIAPQPVPEPAAIAVWTVGLLVVAGRYRSRRIAKA